MAPGKEVHLSDLPPELQSQTSSTVESTGAQGAWPDHLRHWASEALANGQQHILKSAVPMFETALIETALDYTNGRKRDASELLGWGRNTLTRKLKELELADYAEDN